MEVRQLNIKIARHRRPWQNFLAKQGISGFAPSELMPVTATFAWYEEDQMVATGSLAGSTIKYVAIAPDYQEGGRTFNQVVSYLINQAATAGHFHLMVFTKPQYVQSFSYVGFHLLAQSTYGAVLETGTPDINDYRHCLPQFNGEMRSRIGAVVINANPFTRGHLALVKRASAECSGVYVFVVSEDRSLFTTDERRQLVAAGTKELTNVRVVPGGDYMVSSTTFPAYFLKDQDTVVHYQAQLDADLFKRQIAQPLGIKRRYLGQEPFSATTAIYNQELNSVLPPAVEVKIIPRAQNAAGDVISATKVRQMIADGDVDHLSMMVPPSTQQFIVENLPALQQRISERKHQA